MVLGGKVRAAMSLVTNRDGSGAYCPYNLDSKSGRPVINRLQEKHPTSCVPLEEDFNNHPDAPNCLDLMPVYCFEECVQKAASRISSGAGPCGVEADMLKNWLLRHGVQLEHLCEVMATWVDWLSKGSPPYAAYCAVNTVCTVALNKTSGVCLLGIGKCWMRLWSDCSYTKSRVEATNACGNSQLCAGLRSGIEANLHAIRAI